MIFLRRFISQSVSDDGWVDDAPIVTLFRRADLADGEIRIVKSFVLNLDAKFSICTEDTRAEAQAR